MAKITNNFIRGIQDKSTDKAFIPNGVTRHVENLRFNDNDGHDGTGVSIKGSLLISDETEGNTDLKCIGAYFDEDKDVVYYKLASTDGQISIDVEYDINNDSSLIVLKDTQGILNYDKNGYITGWNEINGLQIWVEEHNNVRRINTERAKTYGINGFTEDDITLIVKPPLQKLRLTLQNSETVIEEENNIVEAFYSFSYRYKYLDGEYSVLAPFTEFAFEPKTFDYNYSEQSNRSMVNKYNQVKIDFFTGNERVTEIQLVFKESESNSEWIIHDFNKELLGYNHNEIQSYVFLNNKVFRALSDNVLPNIMDNVPKSAKSQTMIDGRLLIGNYIENYDIVDCQGNEILIDYKLNLISEPNTVDVEEPIFDIDGNQTGTQTVQQASLIPKKTAKSNRDYEVGIVYGDNYGRITTILNSEENTLFIPNKNSITKNSIQVELNHKPPCWATYYRFFIKQNKKGYDQILPTIFYEDGVYRWIKLEGADKDKVKEGDYLIVKSDTQSPIEPLVKVKVLEVKEQLSNFLETNTTVERAGFYFKIQQQGFRMDIDDLETFEIQTYDNTRNAYNDPIRQISTYMGEAHFYGDTLDDMETNSEFLNGGTGVFTASINERFRYLVQIKTLGSGGSPDEFRWSDDEGNNWFGGGTGTLIPITAGTPQALSRGIEITFENNTGHSLLDEWIINARGTWSTFNSDNAYGFFRTTTPHIGDVNPSNGETNGELANFNDEKIYNGARIRLIYDEFGRGDDYFDIDHISSGTYDNIQEFFHKENILSLITSQCALTYENIHFMRGFLRYTGNATEILQVDDNRGTMTMCIRSVQNGTSTNRTKVSASTSIIQNSSSNILLFETEPTQQPESVYFEIGKNYRIINAFHTTETDNFQTEIPNIASDQNQTNLLPLKVTLDWFNAYSYGNAVESYKIKDDYNRKGLDVGIRPLSNITERYKEVHRIADITWSDVYNDQTSFNGLSTFNLSLINFVELDRENSSIQKLYNSNGNLLVYQEDAIGLMLYNKNIIYDLQGQAVVGVSTNILDRRSYKPYADGLHGISKNPESFIPTGSRKYSTDSIRGNFLRLSINGITELSENNFEHWFSEQMDINKGEKLITGYDPKHKEVYLFLPKTGTIVFTEKSKGFPFFLKIEPDFMLNANNNFYAWKNGKMYKMNATEDRNNFFGVKYPSKISFFMNQESSVEKVWKSLGIEGSHPWDCKVITDLTSRDIPKESFVKKEDYWYSEIMGNTNSNINANSIFGLGSYPINAGIIVLNNVNNTIAVGDTVSSNTLPFTPISVLNVQGKVITLSLSVTQPTSFLMYSKNQNIDGSPIRGDILEVQMTSDETEKLTLRAVRAEVSKSNYS